MTRCKITVIRKTVHPELAEHYCVDKVASCPCFQEGQEFQCGLDKPENFCDRAWRDIHPFVAVLLTGGNFSRGILTGG
ncbi:MAG: TIGR04076 family protein [Methanoregula sp.]